MATINGAKVLGLESKAGQIKEGFEADLCGIRLPDAPVGNIVTVHPHLNLPHQGGGIQGDNKYSPPLVGGVRGGGELLRNIYDQLLDTTSKNIFTMVAGSICYQNQSG